MFAVFIAVELNHASQLWCHTEVIGRLPFLDRFLNTPSNHRVHHACDRAYADSNYGATFMLWDKLFGTFRVTGMDHAGKPFDRYGIDLYELRDGKIALKDSYLKAD